MRMLLCSAQRSSSTARNSKTDKIASDIEDFDDVILVLIGPEQRRFTLHKLKLCSKSKFFRAACSEHWEEGLQKLIRLPDVKVESFRQYCEWIYTSVIPTSKCTRASELKLKVAEQELFINLYLLGDSLDDVSLRKAATQAIFSHLKAGSGILTPSILANVWSSTPPRSLFRKLLVDCTVGCTDRDSLAKLLESYPPAYIQEVAMAALRKRPTTSFEKSMGNGVQYLELEESSVIKTTRAREIPTTVTTDPSAMQTAGLGKDRAIARVVAARRETSMHLVRKLE
jgi:hypothetical protein